MIARRAFIEVELDGQNITEDISRDVVSVTYTDNAQDEADSVDITIQNRSKKWLYAWFPTEGDTLRVKILTENWTGGLDCGEFVVDSVDCGGWPLTVTIRGVSLPVNKEFGEVPRHKTWENATIREIAADLCGRANIPMEYEAAYNPVLDFTSQTEKTDMHFLHDICEKHGLTLKMYSTRAVIYDREEFEEREADIRLSYMNMTSFSARATITDAGYTACTVKYTDKDGQTLEYTYSVPGKTEKEYVHVDRVASLAEAERTAKAKLRELNMEETVFSCSLPGNTFLVSGMLVDLEAFGNYDGIYMIDRATHSLGGGYTTNLEMTRVLSTEMAAELEARKEEETEVDSD